MFKNKRFELFLHIGLWILLYLPTFLSIVFSEHPVPNPRKVFAFISIAFSLFNFYFIYSFIFPFFYRKKIFVLLVITILFVILYPVVQYSIVKYIWLTNQWTSKKILYKGWFYTESYTMTILYTGLAFLARFATQWYSEQKRNADLLYQKQQSELKLLKSQINPHFLFNTLNNIYSLVYQKSEKAPEAIMKLSDIMRYMIYETNTDFVELKKELDYIKSYIELMELRSSKKNLVNFEIIGDPENKFIAPMLLIPFVENAFKHCEKKTNIPSIYIKIYIADNYLEMNIKNLVKEKNDSNIMEEGGIGLKNVIERLKLIYPNKHSLKINEESGYFIVFLHIYLK